MIRAELVVLDIGATLVEGPERGPAARIAARLELDRAQRDALRAALMTTAFAGPAEAAECVRELSGLPAEVVEPVVGGVWAAQLHEAKPLAGALEALDAVRRSGARLALIANIWPPYLESVRRHFGSFFDEHIPPALQVYSCREGRAKPSPELFEGVLSAAGVRARKAVMVGDCYAEDIEPAARLGMRTVLVLHRPRHEAADLVRILNRKVRGPTHMIRSIAELGQTVAAPRRSRPGRRGS